MEISAERPTFQDQQVARNALPLLATALSERGEEEVSFQLRADPTRPAIPVPDKALHLLVLILSGMAEGKEVSVLTADSEVGTQRAADILGVSRPHLVKMLETGVIPFKKTGTHRRVLLADLLVYDARQKAARRQQLQFLATEAQELNLGYE